MTDLGAIFLGWLIAFAFWSLVIWRLERRRRVYRRRLSSRVYCAPDPGKPSVCPCRRWPAPLAGGICGETDARGALVLRGPARDGLRRLSSGGAGVD